MAFENQSYGFSEIGKVFGFSNPTSVGGGSLFNPVRVTNVVLDDSNSELYISAGSENGIGAITYISLNELSYDGDDRFAYPLFPNQKQYPLINEVVYVFELPNSTAQSFTQNSNTRTYYITSLNVWNHPHHNALPNSSSISEEQENDYQAIEGGSVRRVQDQSTEIYLGDTFKERTDIHPLRPFEGDIIHEGRWGNSIRFGSTVKGKLNNWSSGSSQDGDPITIIRNGQPTNSSDEGWTLITEDVNRDLASIYATSTQKIPISASYTEFNSYQTSPVAANQYQDNQILLNSGRLFFNSNKDHILFSSKKSIGLSAVEGINIDTTNNVTISSNKIYLGSKDATEPLLLGNATQQLLRSLIEGMKQFMTIASTATSATGEPLPTINTSATILTNLLNSLETQLDYIKSKDNFTI
jgi:hypothetical protein